MSKLSEGDLSLPPKMSENERLRSIIVVKDACIANFSTTLRSIEKKAAVERETLELQIAELESHIQEMKARRQHSEARAWISSSDPSRSGMRLDGASTPGELHARSQHLSAGGAGEMEELRERALDMEKEKNKMEGRVLRAEASSADLLKELRSTYFQLDKTRAQLQEVMNTSESRSPPPPHRPPPEISGRGQLSKEKEQDYLREIAELNLALRRAREEIENAGREGSHGREPLGEVGRELDLLARSMGITNTDQLPVDSKLVVLKTQVDTWRLQREKEGKLLEESKQGMMELLNEFKAKDQQLREAQAVIATTKGNNNLLFGKPKPLDAHSPAAAAQIDSPRSDISDPGTVGFTIAGQPPYEILDITHLIDRNGTPQGTPGCLNRTVMRGDRLLEVAGQDVTSAALPTLRAALSGPVDACVSLRLLRPSSGDLFDITARRHVLMSPRSRAAAGRQLPVSPRSLLGSLPVSPRGGSGPVSPRNLNSVPASPRYADPSSSPSGHGPTTASHAGSVSASLNSLPAGIQSQVPGPARGQWSPGPPQTTATQVRPLAGPGPSLASGTALRRPLPVSSNLYPGGPGQPVNRDHQYYHDRDQPVAGRAGPGYAPSNQVQVQAASYAPSRASAATTANSSQQLPSPRAGPLAGQGHTSSLNPALSLQVSQGGPGRSVSPPYREEARAGASVSPGSSLQEEAVDVWGPGFDDGANLNIWTTNPGVRDLSQMLA